MIFTSDMLPCSTKLHPRRLPESATTRTSFVIRSCPCCRGVRPEVGHNRHRSCPYMHRGCSSSTSTLVPTSSPGMRRPRGSSERLVTGIQEQPTMKTIW